MNTQKYSAKNTQTFSRFAVASAMSVGLGRMMYQIQANGISGFKSSLDFP